MKKILVIFFLFVSSIGIIQFLEKEYNSFSFSNGVILYENVEFDEEFVDYIEQHNIIMFYDKTPDNMYINTNSSDSFSHPLFGSNNSIEEILLSSENLGTYYIDMSNSDVSIAEFNDYIKTYSSDIYFFTQGDELPYNYLRGLVIFISILVAFIIFYLGYMYKKRNHCAILLLEGKTNKQIFKYFIMKEIKSFIIAYILFLTTSYIFLDYLSNILFIGIVFSTLLVAFLIVILILCGININKKAIVKQKIIKNKSMLLYPIILMYTIIIIFGGIQTIATFTNSSKEYFNLVRNEEQFNNFYMIEGRGISYYEKEDDDVKNNLKQETKDLNEILYDMGAVEFSYSEKDNIISTNKNYIEYLGYVELVNYDYIVPESRKEEFLKSSLYTDEMSVYYYKKNIEVENLDFRLGPPIISSPVFYVAQEDTMMGSTMYLPANIPIEEYQEVINTYYYNTTDTQGYKLRSYNDFIQQYRKILVKTTQEMLLFFIVYMSILLLLIKIVIDNYFTNNKVKIKVRKLNGIKNYTEVKNNLIIFNLIVILISLLKYGTITIAVLLIIIDLIVIIQFRKKDHEIWR